MRDNKYKHLTSSERQIIEVGIRNGSSKKAIADTIGKDKSSMNTKEDIFLFVFVATVRLRFSL